MFSFVHISIIFRSWIIIELFFFYRNFYKLSRIRCKCWSVDRTDGVFGNVEFVSFLDRISNQKFTIDINLRNHKYDIEQHLET